MKRSICGCLILIGVLALTACDPAVTSTTPSGTSNAVSVVQNYLEVRNNADADALVGLSCKRWEESARSEADSFRSRNAKIEGLNCAENGTDDGFTLVLCQGKITTVYAGETRMIDLTRRQFKTIEEDGAWKMCGYK